MRNLFVYLQKNNGVSYAKLKISHLPCPLFCEVTDEDKQSMLDYFKREEEETYRQELSITPMEGA